MSKRKWLGQVGLLEDKKTKGKNVLKGPGNVKALGR